MNGHLELEGLMKRRVILGSLVSLLAIAPGHALAEGWSSKVPGGQRVGPKFADHLKGPSTPQPKGKGPSKGKKRDARS